MQLAASGALADGNPAPRLIDADVNAENAGALYRDIPAAPTEDAIVVSERLIPSEPSCFTSLL